MKVCQLYTYNEEEFNRVDGDEHYFLEHFDVNQLDQNQVYWLNFHRTSERPLLEQFWDKQQYHRLTLEDIYTERQRPKVEEFKSYLFFSIQSALPGRQENDMVQREQLSFIVGHNYLISIQERSSDHFPDVRERIEKKMGKIRQKSSDFLLFRMLNAIIDNYYEVIDDISDVVTQLESRVIRIPTQETLKSIEIQKRKLIDMRRYVIPMKEIVLQLEKAESNYIAPDSIHYFSDLKDACLTLLDEIDSMKQVLEGLTNIYYAAQGQRMNEIMKVLTIVSTFFIPLTFVVGVYGMNFDVMPELRWTYGYLAVWIIMIVISLALLFFFFKKGWLKRRK